MGSTSVPSMECGDCCLLDCVFSVWSTYLGRVFMLVVALFMYKEFTMGMYRSKINMTGKVVVITGGNSGVGLDTARSLAALGASIIIGCRSRARGDKAVEDIIRTTQNRNVECVTLDLLSLHSVRQFAEVLANKVEKIDILVNNAGMADPRKERNLTRSEDNLEITLQTNHLSHFLLTNLLKNKLATAGNARVINVSSHHTTPHHTTLHQTTPHHTTPHHTTPHHTTPYHTTQHYTPPHHTPSHTHTHTHT